MGASARAVSVAARASAARSSSRPAPVFALTATTSAPGTRLRRLLERELQRLGVDGVRLRHGDDAAVDAEQAEDREMLVRLRPRTLAGVDHEQEEVDAGRTGDHRANEPLVPRHVDERESPPVRELERGVAEVDRDPARLLFGKAVGVLAGERPDEPRLAVVDVTRSADGQRHAACTSPSSTLVVSKPASPSSVRHSGSVRSRPPMTSMSRSSHLPPCGSLPCCSTS